jgi:hypothetical protein
MKKNNNMDELFREKLLNYEQEPPPYLLENILAGAEGAKRKRRIVYWRVAGVAAALLLAFMTGWQVNYMNKEPLKTHSVASQNSSLETKTETTIVTEQKTVLKKDQGTQTMITETSVKIKSDENLQAVNAVSYQKKNPSSEPIVSIPTAESALLHPLRALSRLLSHNSAFADGLHKMKTDNSNADFKDQSINQQIVEQNKEKLLAQNKIRNKAQWAIGAQISPDYSVNRSNHSSQYASNMINYASNSPVELGGGVSVEYKAKKRWSLQSGIYYSGVSQASGNTSNSNSDLMFADPGYSGLTNSNTQVNIIANKMSMNSNAGVIQFNSIPSGVILNTNLEDKTMSSAVVASSAKFTQNFQYIEIPLYLRYTVVDSKFDVELLGGLSSNVLVGNDTYLDSGSGSKEVGKTKDMETINYSGTLGVGLKYGLSKRIFLNVEPRVKYYLNSLNNNSDVSYRPYTIGVYTGISYQF